MKIVVIVAAALASGVLVLPTVTQAQGSIARQAELAARVAADELRV